MCGEFDQPGFVFLAEIAVQLVHHLKGAQHIALATSQRNAKNIPSAESRFVVDFS